MKISGGGSSLGASISTGEIDNAAVTPIKMSAAARTLGVGLDLAGTFLVGDIDGTTLTAQDGNVQVNVQAGDTLSYVAAAGNVRTRLVTDGTAANREVSHFWNISGNASRVVMKVGISRSAGTSSSGIVLFNAASPTNFQNCIKIDIQSAASAADVVIRKVVGGTETDLATEGVDITATVVQWITVVWDATLGVMILRQGSPVGATYPTLLTTDAGIAQVGAVGTYMYMSNTSTTHDCIFTMPMIVKYNA